MIETCKQCMMKQYVPVNGKCRRCGASFGVVIVEVKLRMDPARQNSECGWSFPLGAAIRSLRRMQHKTQWELGESANVPRSLISRVECSATAPNASTLGKILRALRVESLWLVSKTAPPP